MNKLNITIDLDNYDCYDCGNGAKNFVDDIMDRIASKVLDDNGGEYDWECKIREKTDSIIEIAKSQIETEVVNMMKKEYIKEISGSVVQKLENLFEKTKTYRELKSGLDIEQDRLISSGLREMIQDEVAKEVRRIIKL